MKICFMLGGFYQNGGIGRVTSMLANRLAEDFKIDVTTLSYTKQNLPNLYEISEKVHEEYFLLEYINMTKALLSGKEKNLRKFLEKKEIDILIACGALFFPICVRACKGIATKCICWEHSNPEGNMDHKGQRVARKYGIKKADLNVVLTKSAERVYREKYKVKNVIQIYNPIDKNVLNKAGEYDVFSKKIVSVGRLEYQKYFEKAVEVAQIVLKKYPDWSWDIYGKGPQMDELKKMTKKSGIEEKMCFCGQVNNLYERYKEYSMMVMTSRYEGFPMTLLEGMGNGLPLISFDVPTGPNEIIENNTNGYLIECFDEREMAKKIEHIIQNIEVRKEMSRNSKQRCSLFTEDEVLKQWVNVLETLKSK